MKGSNSKTKGTRKMTADKVQTFMLKDKKKRPETAKPKKLTDLKTNQVQDDGVNLQKILGYYRARVEAHERDRHVFLEKMDALRIKQEHAHKI